jgi:L-ribulose-5-phosphate 4-epimerase
MVLVDLAGKTVEGRLRPSSDTPTHAVLYRGFAQAAGVVHTHSLYGTAFAQAGKEIPPLGTTHADFFHGPVPVTRGLTKREIAGDYEIETGNVICERFAQLNAEAIPAVLVKSHAPFVWGPSVAKAVENAVALELCAQLAFYTLQISTAKVVLDPHLHGRHFTRKHGPSAYYGQ